MQHAQLRAEVDSAPLFRARYFGPMCHISRPRRAPAPGPSQCAAARPGPRHAPYVLHSTRVNSRSLGHATCAVTRRSRLGAFVPRAVVRPHVPYPTPAPSQGPGAIPVCRGTAKPGPCAISVAFFASELVRSYNRRSCAPKSALRLCSARSISAPCATPAPSHGSAGTPAHIHTAWRTPALARTCWCQARGVLGAQCPAAAVRRAQLPSGAPSTGAGWANAAHFVLGCGCT